MGAIFDWDGVIVDSHDQHEKSWFLLADELGETITPELFKESFGMRNEQIIPDVLKWADPADHEAIRSLGDQKEALYRELVREAGIEPLRGVCELLDELYENGIPCSVGSSTPRENIEAVLEITGLADRFGAIAAAADVTRGKPDPEVFLVAARKIGRAPECCVVFEDAHVGIAAGRAAAMKTIAVTTTHPAEKLAGADLVVASLSEIDLGVLVSLFD